MIDLRKLRKKGINKRELKAVFSSKRPSKLVQRLMDRIHLGRRRN